MQLQRLNMDNSWHYATRGQSILIDPWLEGVEVDYFRGSTHSGIARPHCLMRRFLRSMPCSSHKNIQTTFMKNPACTPAQTPICAQKHP